MESERNGSLRTCDATLRTNIKAHGGRSPASWWWLAFSKGRSDACPWKQGIARWDVATFLVLIACFARQGLHVL